MTAVCGKPSFEEALHIGNTVVRFGDRADTRPDLASFGDEVVIGIYDEKRRELFVIRYRHTVRFYNTSRNRT
jgi:hypothetical protein